MQLEAACKRATGTGNADSVADAYRRAAKQRAAEKQGPHLFMRNDILQRALGRFKPKVRPVLHVD